jgi:hypothetical protein
MAGTKKLSATDFSSLKGINLADGTLAGDAVNLGQLDANATNDRSRANHTGTQLANTISDFDIQVRTSRLDQMAAPIGAVQLNGQRAANLAAATADTDAAQWGQVRDLISGRRKADVRVVATGNVAVGTGTLLTIDGVATAAGDRVLLTAQTAAAENGIWVAAAGAWARAADADTAEEFATNWLVSVREGGAQADTVWQHTTDGAVTVGTTAITIAKLGPISSGTTNGYTTTCPATAAGGSWTVTHNLNSRFVTAQVARTGSPYDFVDVRIERTTVNDVTVLPDVALAAGEYEIMVAKVA